MRKEGLNLLYRGLLPPLIMRTTNRAIMFGTYNTYREILKCRPSASGLAISPRHTVASILGIVKVFMSSICSF